MKVKAIIKEINKVPKMISITANTTDDIHKILNVEQLGYAQIENSLMCFFDDFGTDNYVKSKIEYNCDLPSIGYPNHIFGNMIITKFDFHGNDIDCSEDDLKYVTKCIFNNESHAKKIKLDGVSQNMLSGYYEWGNVTNFFFYESLEDMMQSLKSICKKMCDEGWNLTVKKIDDKHYDIYDADDNISVISYTIENVGLTNE